MQNAQTQRSPLLISVARTKTASAVLLLPVGSEVSASTVRGISDSQETDGVVTG